jgi:putative endonuclease
MDDQYYIYIMTNKYNTVLYTGVTNDLKRRVCERRQNLVAGFTSKYHVHKLVYYEAAEDIHAAVAREKQIKGGSRQKKIDLVSSMNKDWSDLFDTL